MNITKLTPVIEQLQTKLTSVLTKSGSQSAAAKALATSDMEQETVLKLLFAVSEFKKWADKAARYNSDSSLQNLPLEYYQICAQQQQSNYEKLVQTGIPALLALGIVSKDGKPL